MNDNQPNFQQITRALISGLALILAIAGQFALYTAPVSLPVGLILSAVAIVLFVWMSVYAPPAWAVRPVAWLKISYQALLIGLAILLSLLSAILSTTFERAGRTNYLPVLILWAGSAVTYVAAFASVRLKLTGGREWLKDHWRELAILSVVTMVAAVLRFYKLGLIPRVINGDEGVIGQAALLTRQLPLANPFALFENFGSLYLQAIHLALYLFGRTPFALRFVPALGGTCAIPALYLLGRYLFGRRVALLAAFLLAVAHAHIHFSRTVAVGYIQGTLLIPLELYFFVSGLEKRSAARLSIAGVILGVHFCVYLSVQIIVLFLLLYLLVAAWLCRPLIQKAGRSLWVLALGVLLMVMPQVVYAWQNFSEFMARLNADGTFQSGWLTREMTRSGQSAVPILVGRAGHAFLSLVHYPAQDFYGTTVPILGPITGVLFLLGLGYALWRTRDHRLLLLNGYFWSVTVAVGVFAVPPSADSYRMLIALPAAILLAAIGLERILSVFGLTESGRIVAGWGLVSFVLAAALLFNTRVYFQDFAAQCRYGGDPQTRFASYMGNYVRTLDREATVYLLSDNVFLYGTHSSVDFLSENRRVTNWAEPASNIRPGTPLAVLAPRTRADELKEWTRDHPGGKLQREYDCDNLMLMAYYMP